MAKENEEKSEAPAKRKNVKKAVLQGRPRHDGRPPITREEILAVASRLFRDRGFHATSIRMIGQELSIHNTSIFHQFPTKEAILEQIVSDIFAIERAYVMQFRDTSYPPDVALYKLVKEEVKYAASTDLSLQRIVLLPELRSGNYDLLTTEWEGMVSVYEQLILRGQADNLFVECNSRTAAEALFALVSLPILSLTSASLPSPEELSTTVAGISLRGLLRDPGRLEKIVVNAVELNIAIDPKSAN